VARITARHWINDRFVVAFRNYGWPDPHFPDERWVADAAKLGARVVCVDAHSQFRANYDTRISRKNELLGERDLVRELLDACRKRDLKFMAYIPAGHFINYLDAHPEHACVDSSGEKPYSFKGRSDLPDSFCPCHASPFKEFFAQVLEEVARLGVDAFYFDGPFLPTGADGAITCYCDTCRELFRRQTGFDLPPHSPGAPGGDTPEWRAFIDFRYRNLGEMMQLGCDRARAVNPKLIFVLNSYDGRMKWQGAQSYECNAAVDILQTEADQNEEGGDVGVQRHLSPVQNLLREILLLEAGSERGRRASAYVSSPTVPPHELVFRTLATLATGAAPYIYTPNARVEAQRQAYREAGKRARFVSQGERFPYAAIWMSRPTRDFYWRESTAFQGEHGWLRALAEEHLPVSFVNDRADFARLRPFRVVILAAAACLSDSSLQILRRYVEAGGNLLACWRSGQYDEQGRARPDDPLQELFGRRALTPPSRLIPSWGERDSFNVDLADGRLVPLETCGEYGTNLTVARAPRIDAAPADGAEVLAGYRVPPPREQSGPFVIERKIGRGRVWYTPVDLGANQLETHTAWILERRVMAGIVKRLGGKLPVEIEAPACVLATFYRLAEPKALAVHLMNGLFVEGARVHWYLDYIREKPFPVPGIKVYLKNDGLKRVVLQPGGRKLKIKRDGATRWVDLPRLESHFILTIQT